MGVFTTRILYLEDMASAVMMIFFSTLFGLGFSSPLQQQHQSLDGHPTASLAVEPGNGCKMYTGFHESLLKSSSSFDQNCLDFKPIYECTIPTVKVLKNCVRGLAVNKECVYHMFKKMNEDGNKKCFCGGCKKIISMSRLVKEVFCSTGSSREGRGTGLYTLLHTTTTPAPTP